MKIPHHAFNLDFDGIARALITTAILVDPIQNRELQITQAVWDTGATGTAINHSVATKLGLTPTGQTEVHTANGKKIANTYVVNIKLPNNVGVAGLIVTDGDLGPHTEVLIGMDVIGLGDFVIQNHNGKTKFSFCLPPFETKYDMIDKGNKINKRLAKENALSRKT